jgi:hypothetical protein
MTRGEAAVVGDRQAGSFALFAIPKAFRGETAVHQRNAIASWKAAGAAALVLCGNEDGVRDAAEEFGALHLPDMKLSTWGTPLLGHAFDAAASVTAEPVLGYVNADIILLGDLRRALAAADHLGEFLMVGERIDADLSQPLDLTLPEWPDNVRRQLQLTGCPAGESAIDYFLFRRGSLGPIPPFAVGRPGWDNWMIFHARTRAWSVIDASPVITAAHPRHGYRHVPGGTGNDWEGPEADRNRGLAGSPRHFFDLLDATHVLGPGGVQRNAHRPGVRPFLTRQRALLFERVRRFGWRGPLLQASDLLAPGSWIIR